MVSFYHSTVLVSYHISYILQQASFSILKNCESFLPTDECEHGLKCFQRDDGDTDSIPGCVGTPRGRNDYCYVYNRGKTPVAPPVDPPASLSPDNTLERVGNNGDPVSARASVRPHSCAEKFAILHTKAHLRIQFF